MIGIDGNMGGVQQHLYTFQGGEVRSTSGTSEVICRLKDETGGFPMEIAVVLGYRSSALCETCLGVPRVVPDSPGLLLCNRGGVGINYDIAGW